MKHQLEWVSSKTYLPRIPAHETPRAESPDICSWDVVSLSSPRSSPARRANLQLRRVNWDIAIHIVNSPRPIYRWQLSTSKLPNPPLLEDTMYRCKLIYLFKGRVVSEIQEVCSNKSSKYMVLWSNSKLVGAHPWSSLMPLGSAFLCLFRFRNSRCSRCWLSLKHFWGTSKDWFVSIMGLFVLWGNKLEKQSTIRFATISRFRHIPFAHISGLKYKGLRWHAFFRRHAWRDGEPPSGFPSFRSIITRKRDHFRLRF